MPAHFVFCFSPCPHPSDCPTSFVVLTQGRHPEPCSSFLSPPETSPVSLFQPDVTLLTFDQATELMTKGQENGELKLVVKRAQESATPLPVSNTEEHSVGS